MYGLFLSYYYAIEGKIQAEEVVHCRGHLSRETLVARDMQ
jgi:hypothetical protein